MKLTLEQRRMTRAYQFVEKVQAGQRDTVKNAVMGLGAEIQRAGLLQALAFLHRGPSREIAEPLCQVLRGHLAELGHLPQQAPRGGLLIEVRDSPVAQYMRITRETMALARWLKRAAEILLKDQ